MNKMAVCQPITLVLAVVCTVFCCSVVSASPWEFKGRNGFGSLSQTNGDTDVGNGGTGGGDGGTGDGDELNMRYRRSLLQRLLKSRKEENLEDDVSDDSQSSQADDDDDDDDDSEDKDSEEEEENSEEEEEKENSEEEEEEEKASEEEEENENSEEEEEEQNSEKEEQNSEEEEQNSEEEEQNSEEEEEKENREEQEEEERENREEKEEERKDSEDDDDDDDDNDDDDDDDDDYKQNARSKRSTRRNQRNRKIRRKRRNRRIERAMEGVGGDDDDDGVEWRGKFITQLPPKSVHEEDTRKRNDTGEDRGDRHDREGGKVDVERLSPGSQNGSSNGSRYGNRGNNGGGAGGDGDGGDRDIGNNGGEVENRDNMHRGPGYQRRYDYGRGGSIDGAGGVVGVGARYYNGRGAGIKFARRHGSHHGGMTHGRYGGMRRGRHGNRHRSHHGGMHNSGRWGMRGRHHGRFRRMRGSRYGGMHYRDDHDEENNNDDGGESNGQYTSDGGFQGRMSPHEGRHRVMYHNREESRDDDSHDAGNGYHGGRHRVMHHRRDESRDNDSHDGGNGHHGGRHRVMHHGRGESRGDDSHDGGNGHHGGRHRVMHHGRGESRDDDSHDGGNGHHRGMHHSRDESHGNEDFREEFSQTNGENHGGCHSHHSHGGHHRHNHHHHQQQQQQHNHRHHGHRGHHSQSHHQQQQPEKQPEWDRPDGPDYRHKPASMSEYCYKRLLAGNRNYDPFCGVKSLPAGRHTTRDYQWSPIPVPPYDREGSKDSSISTENPATATATTTATPDRTWDPATPNDNPGDRTRRFRRSVHVTFGNDKSRSWWKGPNVCKNKTSDVTNVTDTDQQRHEVSYSKSCDQTFTTVRCTTTIVEDGEKMEEVEVMECCPGFSRTLIDYGCPTEMKLVDTFTFLQEHNLTNFLHALQSMGLEEDLKNENITMFAPINSGFTKGGKPIIPPKVKVRDEMQLKNVIIFSKSHEDKNLEDITDTLLNHIVPGLVKTTIMSNDEVLTTTSPLKTTIRVNTYYTPSKVVTANCVRVQSTNHQTKHGVVHIVEKVLDPVTGNMLDYIRSNPDLSDFDRVMAKAGLTDMLSNDGHMSVFAPTNSAFQKMEKRLFKQLLQGGNDCSNVILKNHLLPNVICSAPIVGNVRTPNILKELLHLTRDEAGKLFVNNAQMVVRDVITTNGVVHIIDEVLVPESAKNFLDIAKSKNADIFASMFNNREMYKKFSELKNVTVYLPTNNAMKVVQKLYGNTDISRNNELLNMLKYHITKGVHTWSRMYNNMELDTLDGDKKLRINEYARFSFNTKWTHTVQCVRTLAGPISTCNGIVYLVEKVLVPPESDVMTQLTKDPRLTSFVHALNKTGLLDKIQNKTKAFTVFAPTNDAFNRLNARQRETVESNPDILSPYIMDTFVCCASLESSNFRFRGNNVISCDNMATNGIVHIVDGVSTRRRPSFWQRFFSFDNIF
ncbi:transforming growth factor-beta-induced protein ig-h3-like [Argonauta hians]